MYGSEKVPDDSERTAFRKAEKKYKLYYDDTSKSSKKYSILSLSLSLFHQFALQNMSYFKLCDHFLSGKNNQNQWIYLRSSISSSS